MDLEIHVTQGKVLTDSAAAIVAAIVAASAAASASSPPPRLTCTACTLRGFTMNFLCPK